MMKGFRSCDRHRESSKSDKRGEVEEDRGIVENG